MKNTQEVSEISNVEYNPENQLKDFLTQNPKGHYNDEPHYDYKVSSGSLNLDVAMKGGPQAGILRLVGLSEGGKSSASLSFVKNFFEVHPNSRAVLIPSEGARLESLLKNRGELEVVRNPAEWKNHTCFSYLTNVYELALKCIRGLIENNPTNTRYIFVVDSVDALVTAGDMEKGFEDAVKVAGGALLASTFGKTTSLMIAARGHLVILISQVRNSSISVNKYAKHEDKLMDNISGGNALVHYADWILQFQGHSARADKLWAGEEGKGDPLGHFCEIDFIKAPKNISGRKCRYPIKYLPKGLGVIWSAYEVADTLLMYELASKKGAWIYFSDKILSVLAEGGFQVESKLHGIDKFRKFFDENEEISNYLFNYLRKVLI